MLDVREELARKLEAAVRVAESMAVNPPGEAL